MIEIDSTEKIIRVVRRHWFVLLGDLFILIFLFALPVILLFLLHVIPIEQIVTFTGNTTFAGSFFFFAWLLVIWMVGWNMWTDYYLDILMITDKRIFDIDQQGLFRRVSSSFRIDKIQNVTVNQKGILETLLDFGTITLETAGEKEDFAATYIANPYEIKRFINDMQDSEIDRSQPVHFDAAAVARVQSEPGTTPPSIDNTEVLTKTESK